MKLFTLSLACLLTVLLGVTAEASIQAQVGPKAFGPTTRSENFESYGDDNWGVPFSTAEFIFSGANLFATGTGSVMPNATSGLYQNGGFAGRMVIKYDDGADFNQIQFDVGKGSSGPTVFAWIEAFNNGISTGYSFDFDLARGATVTLWSVGTIFDEVRIGAYSTAALRNTHGATAGSGASIDNVIAGTAADAAATPEPFSLIVWVGLIAATSVKHRQTDTKLSRSL